MVKEMLLVEVSLDSDGATVITCRGEADFHTVGELSEAIAWSIESQPAVLRLDLAEVGFIESSGLGCLVAAAVSCHRHGVPLQVIASPSVRRLLELSGMALTEDGAIARSPSAEERTMLVRRVAEGGPR